jgi:hypothetical protein
MRFALVAVLLASHVWGRELPLSGIRKGTPVRLVIASTGRCEGRVTGKTPDTLQIKLFSRTACGKVGQIVIVSKSNVKSIERTFSGKRELAVAGFIAVAVLGLVYTQKSVGAGVGIVAAAVVGGELVEHSVVRYTIAVSGLTP